MKPDSPAPPPPPRPLPQLNDIVSAIVRKRDKFLLVGYSFSGVAALEWSVVRVLWEASLLLHPSCLQDGHFLVEFFDCHPSNTVFNA